MRLPTLRAIDDAGCDVRIWCFRCGVGATFDGVIADWFESRGYPLELTLAARRFRCPGRCRSKDHLLIVPARRPRREPTRAVDLVAAYFHTLRAVGKGKRLSSSRWPQPLARHSLDGDAGWRPR